MCNIASYCAFKRVDECVHPGQCVHKKVGNRRIPGTPHREIYDLCARPNTFEVWNTYDLCTHPATEDRSQENE